MDNRSVIKFSPVDFTLSTDGRGLWSQTQREVRINKLELAYWVELAHLEGLRFGELRVYFDRRTWNTKRLGLIYTDETFEKGLRAKLNSLGLSANKVTYSEQGMQTSSYVSCDVGSTFIKSFLSVSSSSK